VYNDPMELGKAGSNSIRLMPRSRCYARIKRPLSQTWPAAAWTMAYLTTDDWLLTVAFTYYGMRVLSYG